MRIGIIGGGPAGYASALLAGITGNNVVLFEKEKVGGVCLNRGCIPVKALIKVASGIGIIKKLKGSGIETEIKHVDWSKVRRTSEIASKRLVAGVEKLLQKRNVEVVNGKAELMEDGTVLSGEKEYKFDRILIATGSNPRTPPFRVGGSVWTSDEALKAENIPQELGIIGGGVIGLEFAYIFSSFGSKVVVYEIMDEILPGEDREMALLLRREMEKAGIRFKLGAKVQEVVEKDHEFKIVYEDKGKEYADTFGNVLVSIGREVSIEGIPEEIEMEKGFIKVNNRLETSIKNVYAAGDCIGGYLLAHTAYYEGETAINNMMGKKEEMDENSVPRVVYTRPEFASCGLSEEKLREKGIDYSKEFFPFSGNGRAVSECDTRGGVKILFDSHGKILGCSIIGGYASEMIHILSCSMRHGLGADEIFNSIFAHPTYSEGIREAAGKFLGLPIHS